MYHIIHCCKLSYVEANIAIVKILHTISSTHSKDPFADVTETCFAIPRPHVLTSFQTKHSLISIFVFFSTSFGPFHIPPSQTSQAFPYEIISCFIQTSFRTLATPTLPTPTFCSHIQPDTNETLEYNSPSSSILSSFFAKARKSMVV